MAREKKLFMSVCMRCISANGSHAPGKTEGETVALGDAFGAGVEVGEGLICARATAAALTRSIDVKSVRAFMFMLKNDSSVWRSFKSPLARA